MSSEPPAITPRDAAQIPRIGVSLAGLALSPMHPKNSRRTFFGKLDALGFRSYRDYLRSSHWADVKRRFRESDREQDCYCCGEEETHLHHKTYVRIGAEQLDDLVPLCARCHSLVHVLERRGDLGLDLSGLLDAARAKRYAREQAARIEQAAADFHTSKRRSDERFALVRGVVAMLRDAERNRDEALLADALAGAERILAYPARP